MCMDQWHTVLLNPFRKIHAIIHPCRPSTSVKIWTVPRARIHLWFTLTFCLILSQTVKCSVRNENKTCMKEIQAWKHRFRSLLSDFRNWRVIRPRTHLRSVTTSEYARNIRHTILRPSFFISPLNRLLLYFLYSIQAHHLRNIEFSKLFSWAERLKYRFLFNDFHQALKNLLSAIMRNLALLSYTIMTFVIRIKCGIEPRFPSPDVWCSTRLHKTKWLCEAPENPQSRSNDKMSTCHEVKITLCGNLLRWIPCVLARIDYR